MSQEFKRETRYVILKIKDINSYLDAWQIRDLMELGKRITEGRDRAGKPPFNAIVVEQDWPEFEPTWAAIEARMAGSKNTLTGAAKQELGKQEPVGQFTVSGGRSINQIIKFETYLPDGDYQIYASPQPCPKCASGILCEDCLDTGWLENREEGRYPCTCMTEMEPYQLLQTKCAELEAELAQLKKTQ